MEAIWVAAEMCAGAAYAHSAFSAGYDRAQPERKKRPIVSEVGMPWHNRKEQ